MLKGVVFGMVYFQIRFCDMFFNRANETLDTHMEIPEDPVHSDTSTPLVSFRATDEPEEVVYENEEELEKRLQNANLGDEEEPELQKLLLDEDADNPESNVRHFFGGTEQGTKILVCRSFKQLRTLLMSIFFVNEQWKALKYVFEMLDT